MATIDIDGPIGTWASYTAAMLSVRGVHAVYLVARPQGKELGDLSYLAFDRGV